MTLFFVLIQLDIILTYEYVKTNFTRLHDLNHIFPYKAYIAVIFNSIQNISVTFNIFYMNGVNITNDSYKLFKPFRLFLNIINPIIVFEELGLQVYI